MLTLGPKAYTRDCLGLFGAAGLSKKGVCGPFPLGFGPTSSMHVVHVHVLPDADSATGILWRTHGRTLPGGQCPRQPKGQDKSAVVRSGRRAVTDCGEVQAQALPTKSSTRPNMSFCGF